MKRKIRIAIPNKGRLRTPSLRALQKMGVTVLEKEREYVSATSDPRIEAIFARAFDIPVYVHHGAVDLGFTGHDLILEREVNVHELLDLGFGECQLVVATPTDSPLTSLGNITAIPRVATEYPNLSRKYFENLGKQAEILEVRGASELAPKLGLAQIIIDISSSGETLRKNNLKVIATILVSTCRFACNKISYRTFRDEIQRLLTRFKTGGHK